MSRKLDPNSIYTLTFDCYGTLIDWLGGVRAAAGRIESLRGADLARFVRDRDDADRELIQGPYRRYGEVLKESLRRAALAQGREVTDIEAEAFEESMATWPPFAESRDVLQRLAARYQLAILSNVETRVLESSVRALGAPFEAIVTAEQLQSYKPRTAHWDEALRRLNLPRSRVLHVACSLFHDIRPARSLGFSTAWINRENEPLPADVSPDLVVPDLAGLAAALQA